MNFERTLVCKQYIGRSSVHIEQNAEEKREESSTFTA